VALPRARTADELGHRRSCSPVRCEGSRGRRIGPIRSGAPIITRRQQVGGSAIEASKIAGHNSLEMTGDYTFVTPERQNELTRRIRQKLSAAGKNAAPPSPALPASETPSGLAEVQPATSAVQ